MLNTLELLATVMETVNTDLPPTAVADFQAGVFTEYYGQDVKSNMETCFGPDQEISDASDEFIRDLQNHDWKAAAAIPQSFIPSTKPKVDNCDATDPLVHSMYDNQADTIKAVKNDPDWQVKLLPVALRNKATIKAGIAAGL